MEWMRETADFGKRIMKTLVLITIGLFLMVLLIGRIAGGVQTIEQRTVILILGFPLLVVIGGILQSIKETIQSIGGIIRGRKSQKERPIGIPEDDYLGLRETQETAEETFWSRLRRPFWLLVIVGGIIAGFLALTIKGNPHPIRTITRACLWFGLVFGLSILAFWWKWRTDMKASRNWPRNNRV